MLLRFVAIQPETISKGKIQGVRKNRKVASILTSIIICVIRLRTETVNILTAANTKKPIAITPRNFKGLSEIDVFTLSETTNEKRPIKKEAGKIQMNSVIIASGKPPRLKPIKVIVCVLLAPGKSWQKEKHSISSSSEIYFLLLTKFFSIIPRWPCGPPKAVTLYKKTAFKKGI